MTEAVRTRGHLAVWLSVAIAVLLVAGVGIAMKVSANHEGALRSDRIYCAIHGGVGDGPKTGRSCMDLG